MKINGFSTVADMASKIKKGVNLGELCKGRAMSVSNFRLKDGSTIKLLANANEVDCIVMRNGKVLTAKGTFVENPSQADTLANRIIEEKIANRPDVLDTCYGKYE